MVKTDYTVTAGILELPSGDCIQVGSHGWWEWVNSDEAVAFTFNCDHGIKNYRVRKEAIKGKSGKFWYAYKRHEGNLRKRYIGKTEELTLDRLEVIAYDLLTPTKAREPQPALPNEVGNDVAEYRELLNQARRTAAQRESDFERLIAQKVSVCKENQELKEELQVLHTQLGNTKESAEEIAQLRAENEALRTKLADKDAYVEEYCRGKIADGLTFIDGLNRELRHEVYRLKAIPKAELTLNKEGRYYQLRGKSVIYLDDLERLGYEVK